MTELDMPTTLSPWRGEGLLDLFEARHGDPIHRYCEDRSQHKVVSTEPRHSIDDPPF